MLCICLYMSVIVFMYLLSIYIYTQLWVFYLVLAKGTLFAITRLLWL